jgi:hypothetical protein
MYVLWIIMDVYVFYQNMFLLHATSKVSALKMLRIAREMVHLQFFQWTILKVKKDEKDEKDPHPTTTCIKNPGFTVSPRVSP